MYTNTVKALSLALSLTAAGATAIDAKEKLDRSVYIANIGHSAIWAVSISHVGSDIWGPDLLGDFIIAPGQYDLIYPWNPQGYCVYDVQVVMENGFIDQIWNVNLCEADLIEVAEHGVKYITY